MSRRPLEAGLWRAGALVAGAALVLYLATLSHWYSADSISFATDVDAADWHRRLDPNHLFLHPLSRVWVDLWALAGWTGLSILPLQVLNAIGAAISVGLVFVIAARAGVSRSGAALVAAGCAVSGGMWVFGTEAEDVCIALPAYVALLALLFRLEPGEPRRPRDVVLLGFAIGLGALTYLTFAFLLAVAILVIWQGPTYRVRRTAQLLFGFLLPLVPAAAFAVHVERGVSSALRLLTLEEGGNRYGAPEWQSVPRGLYAFLRTLVLFPNLGINDRTADFVARADAAHLAALLLTYAAVAAVAAIPPALALRSWRRWDPSRRQRALCCAVLYGGFALYWVPSDLEFWLPLTIGWFLLVGVLIARGEISRAWATAGVALLLVVNGAGLILPHHDLARNRLYGAAVGLGERSSPDDLIITTRPQQLFLSYFARRRAFAIDRAADVEGAIMAARKVVERKGGRVLIFAVALDQASRDRWQPAPAFAIEGETVWEVR